jgi:hypothetical protein
MQNTEIEQILRNHEDRIKKLEAILSSKEPTVLPEHKKLLSIKEFILQKKPSSDIRKGLTIAYYLEKYRHIESFTITEIEEGFKEARETIPNNLSDVMYKNTKQGFFMETKKDKDGKKSYTLTSTGEKFVENNFQ